MPEMSFPWQQAYYLRSFWNMYDTQLIGKLKNAVPTFIQPSRGVNWTFVRKIDMNCEKLREKCNEITLCHNSATKMFMKNYVKNAMKFLRVTTMPPKCSLHKSIYR